VVIGQVRQLAEPRVQLPEDGAQRLVVALATALLSAGVSSVTPSHLAPHSRTSAPVTRNVASQQPLSLLGTWAPPSPAPAFSEQGEALGA